MGESAGAGQGPKHPPPPPGSLSNSLVPLGVSHTSQLQPSRGVPQGHEAKFGSGLNRDTQSRMNGAKRTKYTAQESPADSVPETA